MFRLNFVLFIVLTITGFSCVSRMDSPENDSPEKGSINISIDNSFQPVFEQQIAMYEADYPETKINAEYKSEFDCFQDLLKDTTNKLIVATRRLNRNEERYLTDSLGYIPQTSLIAFDAVVIILNKESTDTLFTMQRLSDQLQGKINKHQQIIFDGKSATSTVRFIQDSILKGAPFDTSAVTGGNNTQEVIDFVSNNKDAIGIIGFNRIGNREDSAQVRAMRNLRFGYVQCDLCEGKPFVAPMQESINTRRYPLVRSIFFIMKENYKGLATGFTSFLMYERGQLIFRRAYLGTIMDFDIRNVRYNQELPPD